jgi:hypothetical protein
VYEYLCSSQLYVLKWTTQWKRKHPLISQPMQGNENSARKSKLSTLFLENVIVGKVKYRRLLRQNWSWNVSHFEEARSISEIEGFQRNVKFFISNFRRVLRVVCFLLGNSPALNFVFRNVGIQNSNAGKLPRRKNTTNVKFFTQSAAGIQVLTVCTFVHRSCTYYNVHARWNWKYTAINRMVLRITNRRSEVTNVAFTSVPINYK